MFQVILFFNFAQFWFEFLLILKIGYLSNLNSESLDSSFIRFLVSSAFRDCKFVKFHDHFAPQFNV